MLPRVSESGVFSLYNRPELATDEDVAELMALRDEVLATRLESYNRWKASLPKPPVTKVPFEGPCLLCKGSRFSAPMGTADYSCNNCGTKVV